ncbi:MAG: TetR/AcrR family transcriptional regulator [Deltaproteobacteria bacterium]|nr:TetR/AcrR family transcriptional regulator [Deltaproteobacteria bacterium]
MSRPKTISDEDLLKIARECFIEQGPSVPTRVIALKAGISQPALFKRFKNKDELFLAALSSQSTLKNVLELQAWINSHPVKGPFEPQMFELLSRLWVLFLEILPRLIAMHAHGNHFSPEKIFAKIKTPPAVILLQKISEFVKRAQANGQVISSLNPDIAAMNILGPLQGRMLFLKIFKFKIDAKSNSDDEYIRQTSKTLCKGLCTNKEQSK